MPLQDVYVCHCGEAPMRLQMMRLCVKRWEMEPSTRVTLYHAQNMSGADFQRYRRMRAENASHNPYYVVADDDCLIPGLQPFLMPAYSIMDRYPEFAILAPWPMESSIRAWEPENYTPFVNDDVEEHVSVGGIRIMRKGAMKEWPEIPGNHPWYDAIQADYLRMNGFKVGFLKNFQMIHLGHKMCSLKA